MKVSGHTQIFGIMGSPIEHSLSPVMHNAAFEALGIHAVYLPFLVKPEDLGKATMSLRALNVSGVNVTIPHKGGVIEFLDELDASAKQIGAVNTIVHRSGKLYGYNTDGAGFMLSLRKDGHFDPMNKRAVIIGSGGARIREIGQVSRKKIETFVGENVYLDLWVKVAPNWRRSTSALERFGYHVGKEERA